MSSAIPPGTRKFRTGIIPWFIWLLLFSGTGFFCVVLYLDGWHFNHLRFAKCEVLIAIFGCLNALWLPLTCRVGLTLDGIHGQSVWGLSRFVSWGTVTAVKSFRMLNLRWMRIFASDGKVTYVPLFQAHKQEFFGEIDRLAPPGSPVRKFLP